MTFLSHYLSKKFSPPNFFKSSVLLDFYTFLLFLSKRSRKAPVRNDLLYVGPTDFRGKNYTNSAANLVNSAAHRGKADEILRLTANTQLNFRGLIKSRINRSNTCYELMNPSLFIH